MPEGDTIFRAAHTLNRALAGKIVTRFESVFPALTRVADDRPIVGRHVDSVRSQGKHMLMAFSGGLTLRTHMRMNGSWHIYRPDERWQRPARDMRVLVGTEDFVAIGFNVPVAEFLTDRELAHHGQLRALGPDLFDAAFDSEEARSRLRAHSDDAIGDALLNQQVLAGIGNMFKSETLFVTRIDPFRPVGTLSDEELTHVVEVARKLLRIGANSRAEWSVYGRGGKPCRRCGTPIQSRKTGLDARITYWCPRCQS